MDAWPNLVLCKEAIPAPKREREAKKTGPAGEYGYGGDFGKVSGPDFCSGVVLGHQAS